MGYRLRQDIFNAAFMLIQHWCDYGNLLLHANNFLRSGLPFMTVGDVRMALTKAGDYQKICAMGKQDHQTSLKKRINSLNAPDSSPLQGEWAQGAVYGRCGNPD